MVRILFIYIIVHIQSVLFCQITKCSQKSYSPLTFSETSKQKLEIELQSAKLNYDNDKNNPDAIIWYGRRLAYLGRYDEAIEIFTEGHLIFPDDARMLRHRGHRYLTTRCIDKAISDFIQAALLIKGKKDEIEPDGIPNEKNIPTSTLQSNIWYHLGLAYYLKKDFKNAEKAYKECLKVSKNPDMYVATANWYYITLRELNKGKHAAKLLKTINKNMLLIENEGYLGILLLYNGEQNADLIYHNLKLENNSIKNVTLGFGLGNYYRLNGEISKANEIFKTVTQSNHWGSFAYMAAELWLNQ